MLSLASDSLRQVDNVPGTRGRFRRDTQYPLNCSESASYNTFVFQKILTDLET